MKRAVLVVLSLGMLCCASSSTRMTALPADARASIEREESDLTLRLEACAAGTEAKVCRERELAAHAKRVDDILSGAGGRTQPQMGGANRDCVGDREQDVQSNCEGGKVEKITIPCTHCVQGHGAGGTGTCFVWVCVQDVGTM